MTLQQIIQIFGWPWRILKSVWKLLWPWGVAVILGIIFLIFLFKNVKELPKFITDGISVIPPDQQWPAVAGIVILAIISFYILYLLRGVLGWVLLIGGATIVILYNFSYQTQDAMKKGAFIADGFLDNAIPYTFEPKSLKETEVLVPELEEGDYSVNIFSRKNIYTVKCPWEMGQRRRLFLREENVMTDPELGNILLRGKETPPEYAVSPNGGIVRIERSRTLVISFKGLPQNEIDGCQIASSTPVEIHFKEDRN